MKFIVLFILLLAFAGISQAQPDPAITDSIAKASDNPLIAADVYSDGWQYENAIQVLEAYGKKDAETLWRLARSRTDIGEKLEGKEAIPYFEQAMGEAEQAIASDPNSAMAHQALAVVCGRVALHKGVFKSIGLAKRIYHHAHTAILLDPTLAISYSVIGRTHMKLCEKPGFVRKALGMGWASEDSIAYYFDKAIEADNGLIQTRVTYAEFLLDDVINSNKAYILLEEALALPIRDEMDQKDIEHAKQLMKKLK